ncbi:MAG: Ig-like domain-containing protein [Chitinophagales bacterium]|nr:Ig-like domain-containing protein [Chitinophagales bacterium]
MKTKIILLTILLTSLVTGLSAQGTWIQKANFGGTARYYAIGFSIGDKGYLATGMKDDGIYHFYNDLWEYNPATNAWAQKADVGGAMRCMAVGFSIAGKGYIGTGWNETAGNMNDFWEYSPENNIWIQKSPFPGTARSCAIAFSIGNKGYLGTGYDGGYRNDLWEYNPSTDTWAAKASLPAAGRMSAVAFSIGEYGYVTTGADFSYAQYLKDCWQYNPATDSWLQKADFGGQQRWIAVGFKIGNKGYAGTGALTAYMNDFWEYDPSLNTWTQKTDAGNVQRCAAVGFGIGNKGYLVTGLDYAWNEYNDCWEYTLPADPTFDLLTLTAGDANLNVDTVATGIDPASAITAVFSTAVDAASANSENIWLIRSYDGNTAACSIHVSGNTITIDPPHLLAYGTGYQLHFETGLTGTNGTHSPLINRYFTTAGTFVPAGEVAYWNFENNTVEQISGMMASAEIDLQYATSYNPEEGTAASFNGNTSIVEFPATDTLMNSHDFAISFWVNASSANHEGRNHWIFGLGAYHGFDFEIAAQFNWCKLAASYELADGTTASEDLYFAADGKTKDNGGWQGWIYCKDLTASGGLASLLKDKWAHITCVYNSLTKVGCMFINGELMFAQDFDLWPIADPKSTTVGLKYGGLLPDVTNEFALGFNQSRAGTLWDDETWGGYDFSTAYHFEGLLENLHIFHEVLTEADVVLLYDAEGEVISNSPMLHNVTGGFMVYPNPCQSTATVDFTAASAGALQIILYDAAGKQLKTLLQENVSQGHHAITINVADLTPGIYLLKAWLNNVVMMKKIAVE